MVILKVIVEGDRGREPEKTGGGRGMGDGRRKGGKRERNSKRQGFVICDCLSSSQRNEPNKFYIREKSKNENSYSENSITSGEIGNLFKSLT